MVATLVASLVMSVSPDLYQSSIEPAERLGEQWWKDRHAACQQITAKGGFDVAFLGDSITQGWEGSGIAAWQKYFAPLKSANFGFSGDRTQHVLWRLSQGELIAAKPKVVVMMIGTNNIGHGSSNAEQTATGVKAIVAKIRKESPSTKILLLAIFPRAMEANDPARIAVSQATDGFKTAADEKMVFFRDIGKAFVNSDGSMRKSLMPDLLHLSDFGYELWGRQIIDDVKKLLK